MGSVVLGGASGLGVSVLLESLIPFLLPEGRAPVVSESEKNVLLVQVEPELTGRNALPAGAWELMDLSAAFLAEL
jgi:hypothetical protein